jgi:hypothetical protein
MIQSSLSQFGFKTTSHSGDEDAEPPSNSVSIQEQHQASLLSHGFKITGGPGAPQARIIMAHKEAVTIYFDVEGTIMTSVDISELCEFDTNGVTVAVPYSLRIDWRSAITTRVVDDILYDHSHKEKIADILIKNDKFQVIRRDDNAEDDNCSRGIAFHHFLEATIGSNKTFRVAVRLIISDMSMLKLNFRRNMAAPNALRYPAGTVAAAAASLPSPPPAPNKFHVNPTMETKRFTAQDIPSLHRRTDIQRWYNVLHSSALICGVYTVPWKAFTKSSHMGDAWSLALLTQEIMDRQGLMSAALHALLSSQDIFRGDCTTLST